LNKKGPKNFEQTHKDQKNLGVEERKVGEGERQLWNGQVQGQRKRTSDKRKHVDGFEEECSAQESRLEGNKK